MEDRVSETQVMVIGGGIVGAAIARELSKYKVDVCLVDKEPAIGFGITKGSLGLLHSGLGLCTSRLVKWWDRSVDLKTYLSQPLHLKERFNIEGHQMMVRLAPLLNAKIRKCGRILLAQNKEDLRTLEVVKTVIENMGVRDAVLLDHAQLHDKEPALDLRFIGGLYDPNEFSVFPAEWAIAFAENAKENGAHLLLNTEVKGIEDKKTFYAIKTNKGIIKTQFVINVGGLYSDEIAAMIGKIDWSFIMWKYELMIIENKNYLRHVVSEIIVPQRPRLLVPTPEGQIEVAGIMSQSYNKGDFSTTREGLELMAGYPQFYIPAISSGKDIVRTFVGYMHFNSRDPNDYLIEWPTKRFLNLIVCPPGVGPSPAIAKHVVNMLIERGLDLVEKSDFNPYRFRDPKLIELPTEVKNEKILNNPKYGHIVCRCEKVSEQEVREAVRRGAGVLDGVKLQTRVGMGRCQGGFCTSRVLKIMSEELGISRLEIRQKGGESYILKDETKGLRPKEATK